VKLSLPRILIFYSLWILANGIGVFVAFLGSLIALVVLAVVLVVPMMMFVESWSSNTYDLIAMIILLLQFSIGGMAFGMIIGILQDIVLSKYMHRWPIWFPTMGLTGLVSAFTYAVLFLPGTKIDTSLSMFKLNIVFFGITGLVLIIPQWLALRRVAYRARYWILPGTVGFAFGSLIFHQTLTGLPEGSVMQLETLLGLSTSGVAYSIFSGIGLHLLMNFRKD
jgi:hypothetical protein